MKNKKVHQPSISPEVQASLSWVKRFLPTLIWVVAFASCLIYGTVGRAAPVNLLYFPLTNAPGGTSMPSSTSLGGVSATLSTFYSNGVAADFGGAVGSGVNGVVTGARAICTTNGNGGTQPGNETGNYSGANAGNSAADNGTTGDANLAFGAVHDFVVTMWFNQPFKAPSGSGFVLPRLFVLGTGSGAGLNDGSANSIGVKFQQENQFIFSIGATTLTTTYTSDLTTNKWYFVAWVYDSTNIYQYTGSDATSATLQNQFAAPGLVETFGNPSTLILANRNYKGARAFNGWLEDFRFYTNVASAGNNASFVESIRASIAPKIPTITGVYPDGTSLLQATNTLTFTAVSSSGFNLTNIDLKVNSVDVSSSCTFVTNGTGSTNVTVSYASLLQQSIDTAVMSATDAIGLTGGSTVTFDTFSPTNFIVKAEEFDFNSGQFIDNPDYTNVNNPPDTSSYYGLDSVEGIDTHKGGTAGVNNDVNDWRYVDGAGTRTQTPLATGELPSPTRFGGSAVPSHMVGNWSSGEWQNYTKTFPAGNYNVYARLTTSSGSTINLDQVTMGQGTMNQTLSRLGNFTYTGSGAFQWVPLLQNGSLAVVNLTGQNTIRATTGGGANSDFYMLVPANPNLPVINNVYPDGNYLFEATNKLVFTVSSAAGINTANITLTLNGTNVSSGLVFNGGPNIWNVSYTGLGFNQTYATVISVTDNNSFSANATLSIDTWNPVLQIEAEDFDFDPTQSPIAGTGARYIDNPTPTPPGVAAADSYEGQVGYVNTDEGGGASASGHANYRPLDKVATTPVTDLARRQFVNGALDYNVGFLAIGMWQQYTRTWPSGTYNLYARVASGANQGTYYSSWSQVETGWGSTNQVTQHLGSFAVPTTGGYSAYFYAPLIDQFGNYAQLTLGGTNTFRATHIVNNQTDTPNLADTLGGINLNFYMLVAPRTDLPRIDAVYPDGLMQQTNTFVFVASNPTYGVATNNIHVTLNGVNISTNLLFSGSSSSWNVSYPGLQPNTSYTAAITITDNNGQIHTTTVSFDTFSTNNFTWEAEDFDFNPDVSPAPNGSTSRFIDNPALTSAPATNSYYGQIGTLDIDYSSQFVNLGVLPAPAVYRSTVLLDLTNVSVIPIEVTSDSQRQKYQNAQLMQVDPNIQDYDIFNLSNSAWINYTRTFPIGNFYVYARLSATTTSNITFQCSQVTSGAGTYVQTTNVLGYFQATGNNYATWQYARLINTNTSLPVVLSLNGVETLQVMGDGFERVNYFMLVPVQPNTVYITASLSGSNIQLSFPTQTGYTYTMYYKNNLTDPTWTPVSGGGNPVSGNGSIQAVTDGLGQSHRFYWLEIQ